MAEDSFAGVMASMSESSSAPESSPDSPQQTAPTPESSVPATVEQTAAVPAPAQASEPGPIPYARFKEVNDGFQSFKQKYEGLQQWEQIPSQHAPHVMQFYADLQRDPVGTLIREADYMASAQPQAAQALRSAAARWLRSGGQQAPQDVMPEADLQTQDGQLVYSGPQQQKYAEWQKRQVMAELQQQLQPLQQFSQQTQQQAAVVKAQQEAMQWAQQTMAQWRSRPHFTEHEADIKAAMAANPKLGLADAYVEILTTKVLPQMDARTRSSVVAQMQQKVEAGTVHPSRTPVAQERPKSFSEAMRQLTSTT